MKKEYAKLSNFIRYFFYIIFSDIAQNNRNLFLDKCLMSIDIHKQEKYARETYTNIERVK